MPTPITTSITLSQPGTYILEDDGIADNGISRLRRPDGTVATVVHPQSLMKITASDPNATLVVNLTDSLEFAQFKVGDLTNPALSPQRIIVHQLYSYDTVTLVANGGIYDDVANEADADIYAPRLILSAGTGIGGSGSPLEYYGGILEAETGTGGIALKSFSDLVIGGLTDLVAGLDVATSGDISVTSSGSIRLSDTTGAQIVHGGANSGNVYFSAGQGVSADSPLPAIVAPHGDVTVYGGFGDLTLGGNSDIRAGGFVLVKARSVNLSGDVGFVSDAFGLGGSTFVYVNGLQGIDLTGNATLYAAGQARGSIALLTSPGGHIGLNSTASAVTVNALSGDVSIKTDTIDIAPTSRIGAATAAYIFTATDGRRITLGLAVEPQNALELDGGELNRILAPNLVIGNYQSGEVRIEGAVNLGSVENFGIRSGADIFIIRGVTVPGSVTLETSGSVGQAVGADINARGFSVYVDLFDQNGIGESPQLLGGRSLLSPFVLHGGGDDDILAGNGAPDLLFGEGGNDQLEGGSGADRLDGGAGDDRMNGGAGDDTFFVNSPGDLVLEAAGEGNDTVYSTADYVLSGAQEVERLFATQAFETEPINLTGNGLANNIQGNAGPNILSGGGGNDILFGFEGNDNLNGGPGNDTLTGGLGDDTYILDNANDVVVENAGEGRDTIFTAGDYTLREIEQVELLLPADQASTAPLNLSGNSLANIVYGNAGGNVLLGNGGADILLGQAGDDILNGGAGADTLTGGTGDDIYFIDIVDDVIVENAGEGSNDRLFSTGTYILRETEYVEQVLATNQSAFNAMNLTGNSRDNILQGNNGANILDGKGGNDALLGFGGADTFVFSTTLDAATNVDTIVGFSVPDDTLLLGGAAGQPFAALPAGVLAASAFTLGTDATTAAHRIIYNPATGSLFYDADGAGGAAKVQFAILSTGLALTSNDFIVADPLAYAASQPQSGAAPAMAQAFLGETDDAAATLRGAFLDGGGEDMMSLLPAHPPVADGHAEALAALFF